MKLLFDRFNKRKKAITLFLFCFTCSFSFAQKAEVVKTGVITIDRRVETHETYDDAVQKAINQGQVQAIEEAFGRVVSQDNAMYIENTQTGEKVVSNQSFNSISGSTVKGEWVKDSPGFPDVKKKMHNEEIWIEVKVSGFIRELKEIPHNFESYSLKCPRLECAATEFKDGSDFIQYFKSAESGHLAIYMDDPQLEETFMMLPSGSTNLSSVRIDSDQGYVFFKELKEQDNINYFIKNKLIVPEDIKEFQLVLDNNRTLDQYIIYILFSPNPFKKPIVSNKTVELSEELKDNAMFPKSLKSNDFQKWLQNLRIYNSDLQMYKYTISLSK